MHRLARLAVALIVLAGLMTPAAAAVGAVYEPVSALPMLSSHAARAPQRAPASPAFAQVWYYHPRLLVQPPRQAVRFATLHMPLFGQYLLQTRAGDRAQIRFRDGTRLDLNQLTDVVLRSPQLTYVSRGEVAQFQTPGTVHRVETPTAVAGTFDPTFDVRVEAQQSTVIVLNGTVQVTGAGKGVLVKSNRQTVVQSNQAPSAPTQTDAKAAFAWTDQVPTPNLGEDVALDASGGYIVGASSQRQAPRWHAEHINDGVLSRGWETAKGEIANQTVTLGFSPSRLYRVAEVIIDPAATGGGTPSMDLKQFQIRVSSTGTADGDFTTIYTGLCQQQARLQIFKLPAPALAKYVQLVALTNYGNADHLAVAEFEVVANVVGLAYPMGIAVDAHGNLYVGDAGNERIQIISPRGVPLGSWGTKGSGPGQFRTPGSVVRDRAGNIYVVDTNNARIQKFSPQGKPLAQWGSFGSGPGQFNAIRDVAVDAQGNIYVADAGNDRIQKLSPQGKPLAQWGSSGSAPGQFHFPIGIALDRAGNIYVADYSNARVQKLSPDGKPLAVWGGPGSGPGQFAQPHGIAIDPKGNIYVVDQGNDRVQELSPQGRPLAQGPRLKHGRYVTLLRLALDTRGHVYVTDLETSHILELDSSLHLIHQFGVFGSSPQLLALPFDVAVDAQNNLYISDPLNGRIQKRAPTGQVLLALGRRTYMGPHAALRLGQFSYPVGVAVDRRGLIYVADPGLDQLQVLSDRGPIARIKIAGLGHWIAVDRRGVLYVLDYGIVKELSSTGALVAQLGTNHDRFHDPEGLAVDTHGNVYVVTAGDNDVTELTPRGRTLAVLGASAGLNNPCAVAVDRHGNVFITDMGNSRVVKLSAGTYAPETFGMHVHFRAPQGISVDDRGDVYVADVGHGRVVELSPRGAVVRIWE